MCDVCTAETATAGEWLDKLIETYGRTSTEDDVSDLTTPQHCTVIAQALHDSYLENQGHEQLFRLCMLTAVAVSRFTALQQINGGAL